MRRALILLLALCGLVAAQGKQNWTGDGGKGISIAILAPKAIGLAKDQSYLPALVQGEFVTACSHY